MSLKYENISITAGVPATLGFIIRDRTGVPVDLTGYTYRFEMFDTQSQLKLVKTVPTSSGVGSVVFQITGNDGLAFLDNLYTYRLVLTPSSGGSELFFKGYVSVNSPGYDPNSTPGGATVTLPDGTLYPLAPLMLVNDTWYAVTSYYRVLVTGIVTIRLDTRDHLGNITGNVEIFQTSTMDPTEWHPNFGPDTAFRINVTSGGATIQYLP
jgi:hypothetical protein